MLRNCERCNRVFAHPTRRLCDKCYQKEQDDFEAVKDYLEENPGAPVVEVSNETEVALETIYEFVRMGRLATLPGELELLCEICGVPIQSGRVCVKCRESLQKGFTAPSKKKEKPALSRDKEKIRYLDSIKRRK